MHFLKSIINKYINASPQNAADAIPKIKKKKKKQQLQNAKGLHNHFITTFLIVCGGAA